MQNHLLSFPDSMSISHFEVMGSTVELRVRFISPKHFERFSLIFTQMFLSETVCRTYDSATQTQTEGLTSRSWDSAAGGLAVLLTAVLLKQRLTICLLVLSADKHCKQFDSSSSPTF